MLRFSVLPDLLAPNKIDLSGAYLLGSDGVPLRAEIELQNGHIVCRKRATGPSALAILWPVGASGTLLMETTRLQERDTPYIMAVELLRGRMMRLLQKREEWELLECRLSDQRRDEVEVCREALIEAVKADAPADAARIAQAGLEQAVALAQDLAVETAGTLLDRRRQLGGFTRRVFGCRVNPYDTSPAALKKLAANFDFAVVPFCWKAIESSEKDFDWQPLDTCVEWLAKNRVPIKGADLFCLDGRSTPDWLFIWEHDFEAIRDLIYDHIRRVIGRYGNFIQVWDVISGIHASGVFSFNFEQLMELTRMSAAIARQLAPQGTIIVDLTHPWGEYYARNQRTIPPLLYADMVAQSGIALDAFGLQVYFGMGTDGMYARDLFQVSNMLDRFAALGKPVHITATQVPSTTSGEADDAWGGTVSPAAGGAWGGPWDEKVQAEWVKGFYEVVLSKPFVDTISWRDLSDHGAHFLPGGGLLRADLTPKPALKRVAGLRTSITRGGNAPAKPRRKPPGA